MGECLTYLRDSLFSSTLAPSLCVEEKDLLKMSHSKLVNVGPLRSPMDSTLFSLQEALGATWKGLHTQGDDPPQRLRPSSQTPLQLPDPALPQGYPG